MSRRSAGKEEEALAGEAVVAVCVCMAVVSSKEHCENEFGFWPAAGLP